MEKERVLIGFDFSVNKPACCIVFRNEIHFMFWPLSLSKNEEKAYNETDIYVFNRNLSSISKKSNLTASQMVREHTERSRNLAGFIVEDLDRMFNDTVTSLEEAGALIAKGWTNCMDTIVKVVSQLWEKVNAALGIAYEYIKAFFITLVDYIGTRGLLIKANVDKFMNNIKIAVLEKLKDVIDGMSSGPLGKLLKLIGVDLAGASESLGKSIDKAKEKNKELDTKIGELQTKAKEGFDISANVDTTKVDSYKKTLASGWTVTVNPSLSKAKQLNKALGDALKVKVNIKYTNPVSGKTTSAGDISTSIVDSGMAKGGIAYGMTSAIIGEYAGASHNPEVVAPLNKLQGILERSNVGGKDTMTREQANTMINLLQRIEQKEMTVSPSVGFGQVVQRSLDAYSRA